MKVSFALLMLFASCGSAQVNLSFEEGKPGHVPTSWEIPKNARDAGLTAELRTTGCKSAACVLVDRSMVQRFPAAESRGATIIFAAWLRLEGGDQTGGAQLLLRTDGPHGMQNSPSEVVMTKGEWEHAEIVTEVEADANVVTLAFAAFGKSRVWVDNVSYTVVPPVTSGTAPPLGIQHGYREIDAAYGRGKIDAISPMLRPGGKGSRLPFQSRIGGFEKLLRDGTQIRSSTSIQRVCSLSDRYAVVDARMELTRSSGDRHYLYRVDYRDLWTRTGIDWVLRDAPPLSVQDVTRNTTAGREAGSLFTLPRVNELVPCKLSAAPGMNLGPTDYRDHLLPTGSLSAVMIFVDFPDAPHSEDTRQLYASLVPTAERWIEEVSNGAASLKVTAIHQWRRMPKDSAEYHWNRLTRSGLRTYIQDAAQGTALSFGKYDLVYIVASRNSAIHNSPVMVASRGTGVSVDDSELRHVVVLGEDIRYGFPGFGAHTLLHAMGNLFGLPDLFEYGSTFPARLAGGWDNMSLPTGAQFTAWNKWKLGWISADQLRCVDGSSVTETLRPIETPDGVKALVVPVDATSAYVAEAREWIGADLQLCDEGLLIYKVDTTAETGHGPLRVMGGTRGVVDEGTRRCGPAYDATFRMNPGKPNLFEDPAAGVAIELIESSLGSYTVKASKSLATRTQSLMISRSSVAWDAGQIQPYSVAVTSTDPFKGVLSVTVSPESSWLGVNADSDTVPATLTISANPKNLPPGTYSGTVSISAPGAVNSPRTVNARLTISKGM